MGDTHEETDVLLAQWTRDGRSGKLPRSEAMSFQGYEARSFLRFRGTRGVRLNDANIAKIENVDLVVQAEYLSN